MSIDRLMKVALVVMSAGFVALMLMT